MSDDNKLNDVKPNDNNTELDNDEMTENELDNVAGGAVDLKGASEALTQRALLPAVKPAADGSVKG